MTTPAGEATPSALRDRRDALLAGLSARSRPAVGLADAGPADAVAAAGEFCRRYAASVDEWLSELLERATSGDERDVALLAVGGHGRGELAPGSDLDLVLVHDRRGRITGVAEALWYPIWDEGVALDHSVRTLKELGRTMDSDFKVALGLLEARLVAGDQALSEKVSRRVIDQWSTRAPRWLPLLDEAVQERHAAQGDVAFLLEPDLKEARGGLRDRHQLAALGRVSAVLGGVLADPMVAEAGELLTAVRVALQGTTGKANNRLLLQDQDSVAGALAFGDADALMGAVSGAGRTIAWASDDGWRRVRSWLAGPRGRAASPDRPLEVGLVLRDGEVTLAGDAPVGSDVTLPMRAAAASAELDRPLARTALQRMREASPTSVGVWPPGLQRALLRVLAAGSAGVGAIEALDQHDLWVRLLPEWEPVRNRPQRNAYHRFTVDRHLLETAANASRLLRRVSRPDLLLLGALLHDIGKGRGGDHTEIGMSLVAALGPRMGLSDQDTSILVDLVRHHLLLPDVATRRDLDDPETALGVSKAVHDLLTLELLAALTEADSLATGPAAWGPWKAGLVARLVELVGRHLAGHSPPLRPPSLTEEQRTLAAAGRLEVVGAGGHVTVVAPDRDGLLATVAGVLTLSGATVLSASTRSVGAEEAGGGMAVLVFDVAPAFDVLPPWEDVRRALEEALNGRLPLDRGLAERDEHYARQRRASAAHTQGISVIFDHEASGSATVIEVRAPDQGAVLYRIARALTGCGLTITAARISTLGAEVVDAFYVRGSDGDKLAADDPGLRREIEAAVAAALR
ncbi:MAG: [protein-PII] uridylyltransferase [Acidimicrobiales bacterium]